ncbi:MAG: twin-arginine translocase TatA/TatE family subunit [Acidobacteria bacterium]|nr:twin-arginine translocase TatA/TatE family subunit [Acidobacteriota bacterium]
MLVILLVALILLGPRRLPQMSKKIGKSLGEFKRASEDFKRTWEREIEMESASRDARLEGAILPPAENSILDRTVGRGEPEIVTTSHAPAGSESDLEAESEAQGTVVPAPSVTAVDPAVMQPAAPASAATDAPALVAPTRKRDWL